MVLTPFSANETDVGPKPFQRDLFINLCFSSPVLSSTTVVVTDIGFGLKLGPHKSNHHLSKKQMPETGMGSRTYNSGVCLVG
jgi:hypothetical protein